MKRNVDSEQVRVLIVDDHDVLRTGVAAILTHHQGWSICAEARNGEEAVKLAAKLRPDVVILDLEIDKLDGLAVTRQIRGVHPEIEVVVFTMHDDDYLMREVLSAGARAFVLKSEGAEMLIKAIEYAMEHKPFFSTKASQSLLDTYLSSERNIDEPSVLTDRERTIVRFVASGKSNKEVAASLGISVKTVETHRAAIMRKLNVSSIAELVRYAVRERIIKP